MTTTASPKSPTSRAPRKLIFGTQLAFKLRNIEEKYFKVIVISRIKQSRKLIFGM